MWYGVGGTYLVELIEQVQSLELKVHVAIVEPLDLEVVSDNGHDALLVGCHDAVDSWSAPAFDLSLPIEQVHDVVERT